MASQVAEVQVKGPRYWQQRLAAGPEGSTGQLGALYGRGALPVQLQRWALSYTQDPSGVRGLLSQAFDEVCDVWLYMDCHHMAYGHSWVRAHVHRPWHSSCNTCHAMRTEPHSVQSGMSSQARLREGKILLQTFAASRSPVPLQGAGMDREGFDLVHLCSTFASDPFVMAFAKLIESGASLPCQLARGSLPPCTHPHWASARRLILRCSQTAMVSGRGLAASIAIVAILPTAATETVTAIVATVATKF